MVRSTSTRLLQYDLVTREIVPHVGSFEWIEDFTALLWHVNPGHAWHDGTPLTADDVKFSIDRAAGERGVQRQRDLRNGHRVHHVSAVNGDRGGH